MTEQQWNEVLFRQYEDEARAEDERRGELLVTALFLLAVAVVCAVAVLT